MHCALNEYPENDKKNECYSYGTVAFTNSVPSMTNIYILGGPLYLHHVTMKAFATADSLEHDTQSKHRHLLLCRRW